MIDAGRVPLSGRGSWLARRDPRVLILVAVLFVFGASQIRDVRQLLVVFGIALGYYSLAAIPWRSVRLQWLYLVVVVTIFATFNAILTGGDAGSFAGVQKHVVMNLPFGLTLTAEGLSLAASQIVDTCVSRRLAFRLPTPSPPGDFGVALRRLGLQRSVLGHGRAHHSPHPDVVGRVW